MISKHTREVNGFLRSKTKTEALPTMTGYAMIAKGKGKLGCCKTAVKRCQCAAGDATKKRNAKLVEAQGKWKCFNKSINQIIKIMENEKIYIAGPVTGYDLNQRHHYFFQIFEEIDRLTKPQPINPMDLGIPKNATHEHAMSICIPKVCMCDAILLLPGWEKSRGTQFELTVAREIDLKVYKLGTTGAVWYDHEQVGQIDMPK